MDESIGKNCFVIFFLRNANMQLLYKLFAIGYVTFCFLIHTIHGRDPKPYTACTEYIFADPSSDDPAKRVAGVCSDYMKSRNDTHFQAPLLHVKQIHDKAYDEYYTEVEPNIQAKMEDAVLAGIATIKEFPFYEIQCQNSILGAFCASYLPICDTALNPNLERGCPNDQDLFSAHFQQCAQGTPQSFNDKPSPKYDGVNFDNYFPLHPGGNASSKCLPKTLGSCGLIDKYCPLLKINPKKKQLPPLNMTTQTIDLKKLYQWRTTRTVPLPENARSVKIPAGSIPVMILPDCYYGYYDECFDPYKSNQSVINALKKIKYPVDMLTPPKSSICNKYVDIIDVVNAPTWTQTVQNGYKHIASRIAEASFPEWLPYNCSSALKQLICASPFGGKSKGYFIPNFEADENQCSDICMAVEKYCKNIFNVKPTIFQNVTNNFSLYVINNDITPRLHKGGVPVTLQKEFEVFEFAEYDGCKSVLNGYIPNFIGYPDGIDFSEIANMFNDLLTMLRKKNRTHALGLSKNSMSCNDAFAQTNCTTCQVKCPIETFKHDVEDISATYMVLSSACAMPCPFNTKKRNEYEESIMTRFAGGTVGGISALFLMWLWFAEEDKKQQRTLNMLFFSAVIISTAMVIGPNFLPFKYFCESNVRVTTQHPDGGIDTCIFEAGVIIFGINLFSLLWFCLVIEVLTIEILQKPGALEATPITFMEKVKHKIRKLFYRFVVFPTPERSDARRCPIYFWGSAIVSAGIVGAAYGYQLLGYDGVSSWCSWVHVTHTAKNYVYSATGLHYVPLAFLYQVGLGLLFFRFIHHLKDGGFKHAVQKAILNRMSIFLIWFGMMWCFMIYKKMTSDIQGIFERQESRSKWHKCLLLNVSYPLLLSNLNNTDIKPSICPKLPELRLSPGLSLGIETLVSTGGYLLLIAWGTSLTHVSWIAQEFGFTRAGLTWEEDVEIEQQIITEEIAAKSREKEEEEMQLNKNSPKKSRKSQKR